MHQVWPDVTLSTWRQDLIGRWAEVCTTVIYKILTSRRCVTQHGYLSVRLHIRGVIDCLIESFRLFSGIIMIRSHKYLETAYQRLNDYSIHTSTLLPAKWLLKELSMKRSSLERTPLEEVQLREHTVNLMAFHQARVWDFSFTPKYERLKVRGVQQAYSNDRR